MAVNDPVADPVQEDRMAFMVIDEAIHIGMFDGHAGATTSTFLQVKGTASGRASEGQAWKRRFQGSLNPNCKYHESLTPSLSRKNLT